MAKYAIGIDYGTLSGRAVLADVSDGRVVATAEKVYPHAVMDRALPDGTPLPPDWALQHPQDYMDVLDEVLSRLAKAVDPADIVCIGIDCTSASPLPVDENGTPLCFLPEYASRPHAWCMLWKHHGAQEQARRMTDVARQRNEPWLGRYGGIVNSEWMLPKLLQVLEEAPDIYEAMAHYIEAMDWIIWRLTGRQSRSAACLGYKALYCDGFPSKEYFASLNPRFADAAEAKLRGDILPLGACAGYLTDAMAQKYGLPAGIPVAVGNIDAHVCLPAAGIDGPGKLLAIVGTSSCHIVAGDGVCEVPGMSGVVQDGVLPGCTAFEAGQSCVGDSFAWFEKNCVPEAVAAAAREEGVSVQKYLTDLAAALRPGESGLIALDWFNGNRSVLADADLTGMILGMTLQTRPEEIYRALLESTAYGARTIVDAYRRSGVRIDTFLAGGGIPQKNPLMMQIYADVLNMDVHVSAEAQGAALGSAIYAAVAAEIYPDVAEGARQMGSDCCAVYHPIPENAAVYEKLFVEYTRLHDYFGRGENAVMKRLKALRGKA